MKPKIKVCGMKYTSNIQELIELSPDYMGFIFYPKSPRYIGDEIAPEWMDNLPDHIKKVGVFVNSTMTDLEKKAKAYRLDYIQLHGTETPEECKILKEKGYKIIKAFGVDESFDFVSCRSYKPFVEYFLFDTKSSSYGGSGKAFNWQLLENYPCKIPFFLSGGISGENMYELNKIAHPYLHAIDLNSKFEKKPGLKDIHQLKSQIFDQY